MSDTTKIYRIDTRYEVRAECALAENVTDRQVRLAKGAESGPALGYRSRIPRGQVSLSPSEAVAEALERQRRRIASAEEDLASARAALGQIELIGREWGRRPDVGELRFGIDGSLERRLRTGNDWRWEACSGGGRDMESESA